MLTEYIRAAMHHATYEILEDDGTFFGRIPDCQGVWANEKTLEACRDELESALEDWILFRVSDNLSLPVIEGIDLSITTEEPVEA
jgi:predicted RNase H-like HicB family nuclease